MLRLVLALAILSISLTEPASAQSVGGRDHHSGGSASAGSSGSQGGGAGNNGTSSHGGGTTGGSAGGGTTGGGGTGGGSTGGGGTGGGSTGGGTTGGGGTGGSSGGTDGGGTDGGGTDGGGSGGDDAGPSGPSGGANGGSASGDSDTGNSDTGNSDSGNGQADGSQSDAPATGSTETQTPAAEPVAAQRPVNTANDVASTNAGQGARSHGRSGNDHRQEELVWMNPDADQITAAKAAGFQVIESKPLPRLGLQVLRVRTPRNTSFSEARLQLNAISAKARRGARVDANSIYRPQQGMAIPPIDYAKDRIGWQSGRPNCGAGVRIGVIDSALPPGVLSGAQIRTEKFMPAGNSPSEDGHGAAVLGLILGDPSHKVPGLLPSAKVDLAAAFYKDDSGAPITDAFNIAAALDWLAGQDQPVVNMSFTGPDNVLLATAVERLSNRMLLVAAAGNDGGAVGYPAAYEGVMAVTAVGIDDSLYAQASRGPQLALAAPGVDIWTLTSSGRAKFQSGTSLASPFVAAAGALRIANGETPQAARKSLESTARDLGTPGRDALTGFGLVQAIGCKP